MADIKKRDYGLDLAKATAICSVVVIHVSFSALYAPLGSFDWLSGVLWRSVSAGAVPLFYLCSGATLLAPAYPLTLGTLYRYKISRILLALFVWAAVYEWQRILSLGDFSPDVWWTAIARLLRFEHEFHFYFLHILLLVYAFLPLTRELTAHSSKGTLRYLLALWALVGVLFPAAAALDFFSQLDAVLPRWSLNTTYAAIGYTVLGYYLTRYPPPLWLLRLACTLGCMLIIQGTFFHSADSGAFMDFFLEGLSPAVVLYSGGLFGLLLHHGKKAARTRVAVSLLARASFCIYAAHMLVLYSLDPLLPVLKTYPALLWIPLLSGVILSLCLLLYLLLRRIPFVRKWLI